MHNSKRGVGPFRFGKILSSYQHFKTHTEIEKMRGYLNAWAMGSLMDVMLSTRLDIYFVMGIVSRYQSDPEEEHWMAVRHILKYLEKICCITKLRV